MALIPPLGFFLLEKGKKCFVLLCLGEAGSQPLEIVIRKLCLELHVCSCAVMVGMGIFMES